MPNGEADSAAEQRPFGIGRATRELRVVATTSATGRARRPKDAILLVLATAVATWIGVIWDDAAALVNQLGDVLAGLPAIVLALLSFLTSLGVLWATALLIGLGVIGWRRRGLSRDVLLAAIGAPFAAVVAYRVANGTWPDVESWNWQGSVLAFPALSLVYVTAVVRTARPHLARPMRLVGSVLLGGSVAGLASTGGIHGGSAATGAYVLGVAVAAAIHLAFGSPEGQPDEQRYRSALGDLGIPVRSIVLEATTEWGASIAHAVDEDGRHLTAKLYGRDAYDAQVLTKLWSFIWYQRSGPSLPVTRLQQVEHEAFLTLLARTHGVSTSAVITSGVTHHDDAVLVLDEPGTSLADLDAEAIDDGALARIWTEVTRLATAGIVHGALHAGNVRLDGDRVVLTGFAEAFLAPVGSEAVHSDRAEVLVATAELVGDDRAIAAAGAALGDDGLTALLQYLQPAALSRRTRKALEKGTRLLDPLKSVRHVSAAGVRVAALRTAAAASLGVEEPKLEKLARVSWGGLIMAAILIVALSFVWSQVANIGIDTIVQSIQGANWWWLGVGFALGQLQSIGTAAALLGATRKTLPLGPTIAEQVAGKFIDVAVPSSAGRIAMNVRYFQRFGIPATAALAQGALASFGGFVVQMVITVLALTIGGVDLNLDGLASSDPSAGTTTTETTTSGGVSVWVIVAGLGVIGIVVFVVFASRRFREQILPKLKEGAVVLEVVRDPRKASLIFFGNLLAQVVLALSLSACVVAFGYHVSFWTILLINTAIAMLAGVLPIPGGMGVAEAGLVTGLTLSGVPQAEAVSATIVYRMATFYLPPIWGYAALVWLRRREYL